MRRFILTGLALGFSALSGLVRSADLSAEAKLGERLFSDLRLAQNAAAAPVSCATCHVVAAGASGFPTHDAVPARNDGRRETPRHAQMLAGALETAPDGWGLLHWDGEFASVEALTRDTFTGRNFGWLPDERARSIGHIARVMRGDPGILGLVRGIDPAAATDDQMLAAGAKAVGAYLKNLRFSRDESGAHNGSPYDAFLAANRLPRAFHPGETPHQYARRLHTAVAALRAPRFIDEPGRRTGGAGQPFRFGELELRGMRIFFRGSMGYVKSAGAGNCAECHVPPHFSDFGFHNTGVAQDNYDALHGAGAFAALALPGVKARLGDYDRWLPPSPQHPKAAGRMRLQPQAGAPGQADLGLWNVYANPDMAAPQPMIERQLNRDGRLTPDEVLALTVGRLKTPGLRDLGRSAPYLSSGGVNTLEEVLRFYQRMSGLARSGKLRNAPAEFQGMRLEEEDIAPLAAFLRALDEDWAAAFAGSLR